MSQTLLIALVAAIPLTGLAFLAAWIVDAAGAGVRLRLRVWTAALATPLFAAAAVLAVQAMDIRSPFALLHVAPPSDQAAPSFQAVSVQAAVEATPASTAAPVPWALVLLGLIALGAAARLIGLGLALRRVARLAARSEVIADPALAQRLGRRVRQADSDAPILAGVRRPLILLPRRLIASLSHEQAAMVCAHERAHLAAGDHLAHLFEEVLVRVFWFNPFLTAIRTRLTAAREEACDARALAGCDDAGRRAYAQSLIAALKLAGEAAPVAAFTGFRRKGAERRVRAILKPCGPGRVRALLAAVLAGLGLAGALGGVSLALAAEPPSAPPPPPAPPIPAAAPAPPAPPAPPLEPHAHPGRVMIMHHIDDKKGGKDGEHHHVMTFERGDQVQTYEWDDGWKDLTPEQRKKIEQAMKDARAAGEKARVAAAEAREAGRKAREMARVQIQQFRLAMTDEQRAQMHQRMAEAMRAAREAMPKDDGRVLMRCTVKPDGSADKCERAPDVRYFTLQPRGPRWIPGPPVPPPPPPLPAPQG